MPPWSCLPGTPGRIQWTCQQHQEHECARGGCVAEVTGDRRAREQQHDHPVLELAGVPPEQGLPQHLHDHVVPITLAVRGHLGARESRPARVEASQYLLLGVPIGVTRVYRGGDGAGSGCTEERLRSSPCGAALSCMQTPRVSSGPGVRIRTVGYREPSEHGSPASVPSGKPAQRHLERHNEGFFFAIHPAGFPRINLPFRTCGLIARIPGKFPEDRR